MSQRIDEARAAYYPLLAGDVTGSQGNPQARIGAGFLTDSRLFNRIGQGFTLSQLITDSGRTPNLVATSRLQASAAEQTTQATKYDVLLRVNQAYFGALRAQALGESGARRQWPRASYWWIRSRRYSKQASLRTGRQLRRCEPVAGPACCCCRHRTRCRALSPN